VKVFMGICVRDYTVKATNGGCLELKRGKEYTISHVHDDGNVVVFTNYWHPVPADLFAGVQPL